ncbi:MAG: YraN family protein [Candidatus Improbicoccus pseudotrichonymphae]|uniref:UPF0102 protein CfP315_0665 n=1 Tax=Candidatus Improbicoccus pseudotrichonymphae TaxID=3033792 RepID=A0AA48KX68_9FIRM|nr:MAG: YraN family protein [Candidatus Improbicoccus pseudotrichonymphae]
MDVRRLGKIGENVVKNYLISKGIKIIKTNFHSRYGEIDIIAQDEKHIIFVEVKLRSLGSMFSGLERVDSAKQNKILRTAEIYLMDNLIEKQPRFDVAEVVFDSKYEHKEIYYIENAFEVKFGD